MQPLRNLGGYIREQRTVSQISLRQLALAAGVSNPYLSQIERGLRKPSAEILQQIAKALRISAEALYVQAGILDERMSGSELALAIHADPKLSDRQKQVLLEIYDSFCKENTGQSEARAGNEATAPEQTSHTRPVKKAVKKVNKPASSEPKKKKKAARRPAKSQPATPAKRTPRTSR